MLLIYSSRFLLCLLYTFFRKRFPIFSFIKCRRFSIAIEENKFIPILSHSYPVRPTVARFVSIPNPATVRRNAKRLHVCGITAQIQFINYTLLPRAILSKSSVSKNLFMKHRSEIIFPTINRFYFWLVEECSRYREFLLIKSRLREYDNCLFQRYC